MEMNDLMRQVLELLPNAIFDEEMETGEIVISTGLTNTKAGKLVPLENN
jgi:hypothetical protein